MKHAGPEAFIRLEQLLSELRAISLLRERATGTFYRGGRAFLHFHEHSDELFADIRVAREWERFAITTEPQRGAFLRKLRNALQGDARREKLPASH